MTCVKRCLVVCFIIIALTAGLNASQFEVGELKVSGVQWGPQKVTATITNQYLDYKFVVAEATVLFESRAQETSRYFKVNYIVAPQASTDIEIPIEIPGGFGAGVVQVDLSNVVDTLDALLAMQKFYSGEIEIAAEIPAPVVDVINTGVQAPLFVDQAGVFDILFNRVLLLMLQRGSSIKEIAAQCNTDPDFVKRIVNDLTSKGYIRREGNRFIPDLGIIDSGKVEPMVQLASAATDKIYDLITDNLPGYRKTFDELMQQKKITSDPADLLDGSSILHHMHPIVTVVLLWDIAGKDFINGGAQFSGFKKLGLCNVDFGDFVYLVAGDSTNISKAFYFYDNDPRGERIICGLAESYIKCDPRLHAHGSYPVNSLFDREQQPLYYTYNRDRCAAAMAELNRGIPEYIETLNSEFDRIWGGESNGKAGKSARYWFWSIVVEAVINKVESGGLAEREADTYILQRVDY